MRHQKSSSTKTSKLGYICRLCRQKHALRKCRRFLDMNVTKRLQIVNTYGYCKNCLAHTHSQGTCFTQTGCKYCHRDHHSLLHAHTGLAKNGKRTKSSKNAKSSVKSDQPNETKKCAHKARGREGSPTLTSHPATTSLSALLKQNAITLLPTIMVHIASPKEERTVRCLLDSGSRHSSISSKIVDALGLTTLTLDDETICPVSLCSIYDANIIFDITLRMNNRIGTITPVKSVPEPF